MPVHPKTSKHQTGQGFKFGGLADLESDSEEQNSKEGTENS